MTRYSHVFEIAFTVNTDHDGEQVTADELWDALRARLTMPYDEIIEACGPPISTEESDGAEPMTFRISRYDASDGHEEELGTAPSLNEAKTRVETDPDVRQALKQGWAEWEGPEHRGGQPGTWTLYLLDETQYVIERK